MRAQMITEAHDTMLFKVVDKVEPYMAPMRPFSHPRKIWYEHQLYDGFHRSPVFTVCDNHDLNTASLDAVDTGFMNTHEASIVAT